MTSTSRFDDVPSCRSRCHEGTRPPAVMAGRRLCAGCRERAEEDLVELSMLYELCTFALELRDHDLGARSGNGCPQGLGSDHLAVAIQADGLAMLASWCGVVAGARGVTPPSTPGARRLTTFLAVHFDWLTRHPSAAEFADELGELASALRDTLEPAAEGLVRDRLE